MFNLTRTRVLFLTTKLHHRNMNALSWSFICKFYKAVERQMATVTRIRKNYLCLGREDAVAVQRAATVNTAISSRLTWL